MSTIKSVTVSLKLNYIALFLTIFSFSCTENYQLEFPQATPKLVIEGSVTNLNQPARVRLTLSKTTFMPVVNDQSYDSYLSDGFEAVKDALVLIKYNDIVDTLQLAPDSVYVYQRDSAGNIYDSVLLPNRLGGAYGYYQSRNNIGFPGTLYLLEVHWDGKLYTSQSRMPQPVSIDSVTYVYTQGEMGKPDYYLPYIWFRDNPSTTDFYLFKTSGGGVWGRAILSDKFISTEISGLNVFRGESPNWWMTGYPQPGEYYSITMHSIPYEAFEYYRALISQFRNDGGVYTPSPTSPPTNISHGALGLFMASTVAVVWGIMPYPEY